MKHHASSHRFGKQGISLAASLMILFILAVDASAATIVQYDFENPAGSSTSTANPTAELSGITGSVFSVVDEDADGLDFSTFASDTAQRSVFEFTDVTSISAGASPYWEFTVTSTDLLNLESISLAIGKAGSNAGTAFYNVSSSVDGHSTLLSGTDFSYSGAANAMSAPANQLISLASPAFQNLDASSGVSFRIYYAESSLDNSTGARLDTVILEGTVVPEPSTMGAFLASGLGLLAIRRRKV